MIDQFIQQAASQYGLSPDVARGLTGQVAAALRQDGDDADYQAVAAAVPGLDEAAQAAEAAEAPAPKAGGFGGLGGLAGGLGGGLGGLAGMAAKAAGAGGAMDLLSKFTGAGLSLDSAGGFVQLLVKFLKDKAGDAVVGKLVAQVPGLGRLLG